MDGKVGLVIEGGGMRVLYAVGVMEQLLRHELHFPYVVGVSAGASNSATYVSRQKGRGLRVNVDYIRDWRYMSWRSWLLRGSYVGHDFIFGDIPARLDPFDFETFHASPTRYEIGATDCRTGEAVFFGKEDATERLEVLRASVSLPLLCPVVRFGGRELLDGGVAMPIPLPRSVAAGNTRHVVVLSREPGYRKKPVNHLRPLLKVVYRRYPKLVEAMLTRHERYNRALEQVERLEQEGTVLILRPQQKPRVSRLSHDPAQLTALYEQGLRDAGTRIDEIKAFAGCQES
jgi:predicted patatin/cPLA2 family phospholipase